MPSRHDLEITLKSKTPIIAVETRDESEFLRALRDTVFQGHMGPYQPIYIWTISDGLRRFDIALENDPLEESPSSEPDAALRVVKGMRDPGVFVFLDFHPYLKDPTHVRMLKDLAISYDRVARSIILASHKIDIPKELEPFAIKLEISPPTRQERLGIVQEVAKEWQSDNEGDTVKADKKALELMVDNLSGLNASEVRRLARGAIYEDGAISHSDLPEIMKAKYQLLTKNGVLEYEYDTVADSEVAGMSKLKTWLNERKNLFRSETNLKMLDRPKGVLLLGVQGCGKSTAAKAAAHMFAVPLLRLDFGALYRKYYGESEQNLREALKTAELLEPCVLWLDELEKGLSVGGEESGTGRRVLGTFLTWLSERKSRVFLVATANDIQALPPELIRKGRFDEIFFVDLPSPSLRKAIFKIHFERREQDASGFDLEKLASVSDGFSGAEIEQAIISALYRAYNKKQVLTAEHVLHAIRNTQPLAVVMGEKIAALRAWADGRTVLSD